MNTTPATKAHWNPQTRTEFDALEARKHHNRSLPRLKREEAERVALDRKTDETIEMASRLSFKVGQIVEVSGKAYKVALFSPASRALSGLARRCAEIDALGQIFLTKPKGHKTFIGIIRLDGSIAIRG